MLLPRLTSAPHPKDGMCAHPRYILTESSTSRAASTSLDAQRQASTAGIDKVNNLSPGFAKWWSCS